MTASESHDIEVGKCIYNCEHTHSTADPIYTVLPKDISELNNETCRLFNRQGRLCGHCEEDHYPQVYSYNLKCKQCAGRYNWLKYIAVAFLPQTVFFILVISCRISATSPQLNVYVIIAQSISAPVNMRLAVLALEGQKRTLIVAKNLFSLYGIWNLDFFRMIVPDICLHVTTLQALALDYVLAVYPLILTVICYISLQLYTYNTRFIAYLLRPCNVCLARIRNQIDARTSFIDAFATFLLLSYVKLISVSFDLLVPTEVYNATGHKIGLYLYYDANVQYFGKQHLPYAITALTVVFVFILLPLLLLMAFPMRRFQRLLGKFHLQSQALRIFMDSFQGCYKDGTDGKQYDCRYFPAIYLLLRIFLFTAYALTLNETWYSIAIIAITVVVILIIVAHPYKKEFSSYNDVEAVLGLLLVMWLASVQSASIATIKAVKDIHQYVALVAVVTVLPHAYISFIVARWIFTRERVQVKLKKIFPFRQRNQYEELQGNDSFLEGVDQRNEFNEAENVNAAK